MEDAILRDSDQVPKELLEYIYRKDMGLTSAELQEEPMDKFLINLQIMNLFGLKQKMDLKEMEHKTRK